MRAEDTAGYPLTPMQQGMLYQALAQPESGVYIEQVTISVDERLDVDAYEAAWAQIIARHDILRTRFVWHGLDAPVQVVEPQAIMPVQRHDCRTGDADLPARLAEADGHQPFDLTKAPAMRLCVMQLADAQWRMLWTFHHILLDGRSFTIILDEVMQLYVALKGDAPVPVLPAAKPFRDLVEWYRAQDLDSSRRFWSEQLAGLSGATPLPWAPEPEADDPARQGADRILRYLPAQTTAQLSHIARRRVVGWAGLVETAWAILLWRHTHIRDLVFGTTRSGRQATVADAGHRVGLFINTVPKRVRVDPQMSIGDCMQAVSDSTRASRGHQQLGLADIQRQSGLVVAGGLFETAVVYDYCTPNDTIPAYTSAGTWNFELRQFTGYPLMLVVYGGESLRIQLEFDRGRFDAATANDLLDRLVVLLAAIADAQPQTPVRDLTWLTQRDVDDHLLRWNDTDRELPPYASIYDALAAQAAARPDRTALICGDYSVSYASLLGRIDVLAARLQSAGVAVGDRVAVAVGRSEHMVIATLAVQRVGAAYVPCDPRYPAERLELMWMDARAGLIVTEVAVAADLPASDLPRLLIDAQPEHPPEPLRPVEIGPDMPAHVIFTSGSTGRPKGVVVSHLNVMNFLDSMARTPGLVADQRILAVTTLSFDIALAELFLPLTVGAAAVIADMDDVLDGVLLGQLIARHRIDVIQATPTTYRLLRMAGWTPPAHCKAMVGGETLDPALADDLRSTAGPGFVLWNLYGPTETTVYSSGDPVDDGPIHIGTPIANTQFYVVDEDNRLVAPGVAGELLIGGHGVALGYFDQPELTAARFIEASVSAQAPVRRLYHSGDRVRWQRLADGRGRLLFVGRLDNQVKLRGFRIELGEIEAALAQHERVNQAAVVLRHEGGDRLVAYMRVSAPVNSATLRDYLGERLPAHMVPAVFVVLETLPMTENGKVDRNALPLPPEQRIDTGKRYIAPRSDTERAVAAIWSDVLGVVEPGIDDNFFDVGGDSLRIVTVRGRLETRFGSSLSVADLFQYATIRDLSQRLDRGAQEIDASADAVLDERAQKKRAAMARRGRAADRTRG
ncbi:amino acid adenylation domain-containing protein [Salinisphaera aquimarina]|uniref:Amino acid adenylation domain-containing protein n=1 Tax=Salinisphaera aquimarina TaxID=2094031 RepID=A0ABV7ET79_9GAMM